MLSSKKKGTKKPPKNASSTLAGSAKDVQPQKINVLDPAAVKRELDEAVIRAAKSAGYKEDYFVSNVKIILGLATCAIALVAQFWPQKHPNNFWLLLTCIIAYTVCSSALNLFLLRFEGEAFFFTIAKKDGPALKLEAKMPRYSNKYTLIVSQRSSTDQSIYQLTPWLIALRACIPGLRASSARLSSPGAEMTQPVAQYFSIDGYLDESRFWPDVQRLLHEGSKSTKSKSR